MIVLTRGLDEPVIVAGIDPAFSSLPFFRSLFFYFFIFFCYKFSREAFCFSPLMTKCALMNLYICWLANGDAKEGGLGLILGACGV